MPNKSPKSFALREHVSNYCNRRGRSLREIAALSRITLLKQYESGTPRNDGTRRPALPATYCREFRVRSSELVFHSTYYIVHTTYYLMSSCLIYQTVHDKSCNYSHCVIESVSRTSGVLGSSSGCRPFHAPSMNRSRDSSLVS